VGIVAGLFGLGLFSDSENIRLIAENSGCYSCCSHWGWSPRYPDIPILMRTLNDEHLKKTILREGDVLVLYGPPSEIERIDEHLTRGHRCTLRAP